jgi:hypothetical protein
MFRRCFDGAKVQKGAESSKYLGYSAPFCDEWITISTLLTEKANNNPKTFCTFAPVNPTKKRHIASWVLLAVFVPMLLFSSLHIHDDHGSLLTECAECVAHHCQGHITQTDASFDDCVLCQFLSLTFVGAAIAAVACIFSVSWIFHAQLPAIACEAGWGNIVTRGPPAA